MNRKLSFTAFLLLLAYVSEAQGSCWRFGHRCWGGHGKRSGSPPLSQPSIPVPVQLPVEISSLNQSPAEEEDVSSYNYNIDPSSSQDFSDPTSYQTEDTDSMASSARQLSQPSESRRKYISSLSSLIYSSYKETPQVLVPVLTDDKFGPAGEQYGDLSGIDSQETDLESTDPESQQTIQILDYSSNPTQDLSTPLLFLRVPRFQN